MALLSIGWAVWDSLLTLVRTAWKESWEQKPDRCGFRGELEGEWNVVTGDCIFNKSVNEFCTEVLKNRILAGKEAEPKDVFVLFCVK